MPPEGSNLYGNADTLIMQTAWSVPLVSTSELEIKKILRSTFGNQLERYSRQMQIFSRQFI